MPFAFLLLLLLPLPASHGPGRAGDVTPVDDYEQAWTTLLQEVVDDQGGVRYDLLRGTHNLAFRRILKAIEEYDTHRLTTDAEKLAYWMNAYNIQMVQNIIETPTVRNIIADGYADQFFKTPYRTAQHALSLDQIENGILRRSDDPSLRPLQPTFLEPRIHVGLNCAAISCPRLRRQAFTAATVDDELDHAMRDFVNSTVHFRLEDGQFVLSSLLDWYGSDFDIHQPAGDYLLSYMSPDRPDYAALQALLTGNTAQHIRTRVLNNQPAAFSASSGQKVQATIRYAYDWPVNSAEQ